SLVGEPVAREREGHAARADAEQRDRNDEKGEVVPDGGREDADERHLEEQRARRQQEQPGISAGRRWVQGISSRVAGSRKWRASITTCRPGVTEPARRTSWLRRGRPLAAQRRDALRLRA